MPILLKKEDFDCCMLENNEGAIPFFIPLEFGERTKRGSWVQLLRFGAWNHPVYGPVEVNKDTCFELKQHFDDKVRGIDIAFDTEHKDDKGAVGWIKEVEVKPNGLWAFVEWTPRGWQLIKDKTYRYVSAEFSPKYEDPETGKKWTNVLVASTLTNRPFIKGMAPVLLSEEIDKNLLLQEELLIQPIKSKEEDDSEEKIEEIVLEERKLKTMKMKKKRRNMDDEEEGGHKVGKHMMDDDEMEMEEFGELDSGMDLDAEEFSEIMAESDVEEDDDTVEYDEEDEEDDTVEYDEEDEEDDTVEYDENSYNFSEDVADIAARRELVKLSEQVNKEQEKNRKLSEAIKLSAIEDEVNILLEDPETGIGRIKPEHFDLATRILMELPNRQANMVRQLLFSLPGCVQYGEIGFESDSPDIEIDGDKTLRLAEKMRNDSKDNSGKITMTMGEAVKKATKQLIEKGGR